MSSTASAISSYVGGKAMSLQQGYLNRESWAIGQLAALRQSGWTPGNDPRVWATLFEGMPPELEGRGSAASYSEIASLAALVLFAHHQQSMSDPMHRAGVKLGSAVAILARERGGEGEPDASTMRRFQAAGMAQTHAGRVTLLRQLISMMRAQKTPTIGLDYGLLASDLYRLHFPAAASQVRLAWGRQLHQLPDTTFDKHAHSNTEES